MMRVRRYLEGCKVAGRQMVRTNVSGITNQERIYPTRGYYIHTNPFHNREIESYDENKWDGEAGTSDQQKLGCSTLRSKAMARRKGAV